MPVKKSKTYFKKLYNLKLWNITRGGGLPIHSVWCYKDVSYMMAVRQSLNKHFTPSYLNARSFTLFYIITCAELPLAADLLNEENNTASQTGDNEAEVELERDTDVTDIINPSQVSKHKQKPISSEVCGDKNCDYYIKAVNKNGIILLNMTC